MKPQPDIGGGGYYEQEEDPLLTTIARSDYLISVLSPYKGEREKLKIIKNKHGKLGEKNNKLNPNSSIELLIELISKFAFEKTSGLGVYEAMFKEELTDFIKDLMDKYAIREEAIKHLGTLKELEI